MPLFWRALFAFLALPVVVAGVMPLVFFWPNAPDPVSWGVPIIAVGVALLVWCVREFYVAGKGTLAPWDPPRHLVTTGPYRFSRNPMYVAVVTILLGWAITMDIATFRAPLYYALIIAVAFHVRVMVFEEPWARERFGADWEDYRRRVRRWF